MKRFAAMLAAFAAVFAVVAVLGAAHGDAQRAPSSDSATSAVSTDKGPSNRLVLRFFERDTQQNSIDLGSPGQGPGDLLTFSGNLFRGTKTGPKVGRADGSCTTTSGNPKTPGVFICTIAFSLADGQVETQTAFDTGKLFSGVALPMAIVGGTGVYRSASGDGIAQVPDPNDSTAATFELRILRSK